MILAKKITKLPTGKKIVERIYKENKRYFYYLQVFAGKTELCYTDGEITEKESNKLVKIMKGA